MLDNKKKTEIQTTEQPTSHSPKRSGHKTNWQSRKRGEMADNGSENWMMELRIPCFEVLKISLVKKELRHDQKLALEQTEKT